MPKVELGTFGVVAGEELKKKMKKKAPGGGCFLRLWRVVGCPSPYMAHGRPGVPKARTDKESNAL
jgi:hypothetical protein